MYGSYVAKIRLIRTNLNESIIASIENIDYQMPEENSLFWKRMHEKHAVLIMD